MGIGVSALLARRWLGGIGEILLVGFALALILANWQRFGESAIKQEGTGLGLTLCRKFNELPGGKIWVKSQVGVGSMFTFRIPVRSGE
jgi:signal transduction histidine kinase